MILGIQGGIGQGKTLAMVFFALQEFKEHGKRIYANFHLKGIPYDFITFDEFIAWSKTCGECMALSIKGTPPEICGHCGGRSFRKSVILIDEAHVWMDARTSASKMNRLQTYLLLQTGKEGINLYYTTQSFRQVELRLFQRTDIFMTVRKKNVDGSPCHLVKVEDVTRRRGSYPSRLVIHGKDVWEFYDTQEVVRVPETLLNGSTKTSRVRRELPPSVGAPPDLDPTPG